MNAVTRAAIRADVTVPADRKATGLSFLEGKADTPLPRLLVTQAEAARTLSVSRITIYRLVNDRLLHPVMIRGARRYRLEELCRLAERKT